MASFEDKFRELERVFEKLSAKFDSQLLASSSYGFASPGIRSKVGYDDRTLLVKIHLEEYSVSWDVLNQVFSKIGYVEYIEVFANDSQFHSQVRFQEHGLAAKAFEYLDDRCIYDDCCRMELFLGVPIIGCGSHLGTADDICKIEPRVEAMINEITPDPVVVVEKESPLVAHVLLDKIPMEDGSEILQNNCIVGLTSASGEVFPSPLTPPMVGIEIEVADCDDPHVDSRSAVDETQEPVFDRYGIPKTQLFKVKEDDSGFNLDNPVDYQHKSVTLQQPEKNPSPTLVTLELSLDVNSTNLKVIPNSTEVIAFEGEPKQMVELIDDQIDSMVISWVDLKLNSFEILDIPLAYNVFVKMSRLVPGIDSPSVGLQYCCSACCVHISSSSLRGVVTKRLQWDPGRSCLFYGYPLPKPLEATSPYLQQQIDEYGTIFSDTDQWVYTCGIWIFDPGGSDKEFHFVANSEKHADKGGRLFYCWDIKCSIAKGKCCAELAQQTYCSGICCCTCDANLENMLNLCYTSAQSVMSLLATVLTSNLSGNNDAFEAEIG